MLGIRGSSAITESASKHCTSCTAQTRIKYCNSVNPCRLRFQCLFQKMEITTLGSSNWKKMVFHLCHVMTHPLRKIVHTFFRFHPELFHLTCFLKFFISITSDFPVASWYLLQKGQIIIKTEFMLCFHKLWVDPEKIRHYCWVTTVSFTSATFCLWIEKILSLPTKIYIWFWMENLYLLFQINADFLV